MSEDQSPILPGLLEDDGVNTREVMALVGFAGQGRGSDLRLYPDIDFQRWMDIPAEDIVEQRPLTDFNPSRRGRTVVWVTQESMERPVFTEEPFKDAAELFPGSWISTFPLIPKTRLTAAQILDLVPHLAYEKRDE